MRPQDDPHAPPTACRRGLLGPPLPALPEGPLPRAQGAGVSLGGEEGPPGPAFPHPLLWHPPGLQAVVSPSPLKSNLSAPPSHCAFCGGPGPHTLKQ